MAAILIVDDRASNRQFLTTLLGYGGHRLLEATNGADALDLVRAERPDLVITDILMPNMDGYEFVQHLRSDPELAPTRVIFHTAAYSAPEARTLAQSCGVEIVLPKPCEPQEILAAVNRMLEVEVSAVAAVAAAKQGVAEANRLRQIDDTGTQYLKDLRAVKLDFDEVVGHSAKLIAQRELARGLSKRLSTNVDSLQRVMSRLSALIEVGMEMESERDPAKLVQLLFAAACDIVDSRYAAVGVLDEQEKALRHVYAKGVEPGIFQAGGNGRAGLLGSLLAGHRAIRARSLDSEAGAKGLPAGHPPVLNILAVPIRSADRAYGWIYFADNTRAAEFSVEDERLASIMATKLGLLYENLRFYNVIQRHAAKLQVEADERRRAQEALREREAGLHRAQEVAKLAHVITRPDGSFETWSETLPKLLGVTAAQMPRSTREWLEFLHPDDRAGFREASIGARTGGTRADVGYRLRRTGGAWIHVQQVMEPLEGPADAKGRKRWFNTLQDVTGQKRAAEALRESEERFRAMFEKAAVGITHSDLDGRFVMVNPKFFDITGYTPEEAQSLTFRELTHPDHVQNSVEARTALLSGIPAPYEREMRLVRKDGAHIWAHVTTSLVRAADATPLHFISVIHDVTERKQVEEAHRESEERFRQLAENIREAFFLLDPVNSQVLYVSPAYEDIWQRSASSLYANPRTWTDATLPEDRQSALAKFGRMRETGRLDHEYRIARPDGAVRWIHARGFPIRNDAGEVFRIAGIAEDITDRKQAETRILRLNRVYAVLSGINTLIVRVRDREALFRDACRIAVEAGGFRMAWLGVVDRETKRVNPVAWHGIGEDYIRLLPLELDDSGTDGRGLIGLAIQERKAMVSNDMLHDPRVLLKDECRERGFNSMAMLPLLVGEDAVGVMGLYAGEAGFFDDDEIKLLEELAGDIAFALDYIEKASRLDFLAFYDPLTGLPNRTLFHDRLSHQMHGRGAENIMIAVALLDLERFRRVNETLGRPAGDELLRIVGARLKHANEGAARLGIDLFGVALRGAQSVAEVNRAVESIAADCFAESFAVRDAELSVACRVGVAVYPVDGSDADTLLRNAEAALRRSKRSGERIVFYAPEMNARVAEALATENKLRRALERREFVLHYQPKVSLPGGRITGLEALIRWQDPEKGLIPPGHFIPILEETGLIVPVGGWAIEQALTDLGAWAAKGFPVGRVAVNVSTIQLQRKDFLDAVIDAVQRAGDTPEGLEIEITESLLMHDIDASIRKLAILRGMGIRISMDDFGTGYSSLSYLARLPVDTIKIDRSFVSGMVGNAEDAAIVSGIIALVHSLHLKVIAEGVETAEQARHLAARGCDEAQGYFYSRPVPATEIEALMLAGGTLPAGGADT